MVKFQHWVVVMVIRTGATDMALAAATIKYVFPPVVKVEKLTATSADLLPAAIGRHDANCVQRGCLVGIL